MGDARLTASSQSMGEIGRVVNASRLGWTTRTTMIFEFDGGRLFDASHTLNSVTCRWRVERSDS